MITKFPKPLMLPLKLWVLFGILTMIAIAPLFVNQEDGLLTGWTGTFALFATLIALLAYAYYTYLLAKQSWAPSAAFVLKQEDFEPFSTTVVNPFYDPYHIIFEIKNYTKASIKCWCKLNATTEGKKVALKGFYNGKSSFDVQPLGQSHGHFHLQNLLSQTNKTIEDMIEKSKKEDIRKLLCFKVEFWYESIETGTVVKNIMQPFYFDFQTNSLVADF